MNVPSASGSDALKERLLLAEQVVTGQLPLAVADGETLAQDKPEPKPPGNPAGFVVHARAEALMQKHPELDYREAIGAVLSEDRELKVRYAGMRQ